MEERILTIEQIKEFKTIGELKERVREVEDYNKQIQADINLTKVIRGEVKKR